MMILRCLFLLIYLFVKVEMLSGWLFVEKMGNEINKINGFNCYIIKDYGFFNLLWVLFF